ncbi:DUF4258 domain-containing protein [Salinarimonas chemoclinalis]|uniref:DUF4258 domain-containing protein n=1 Tax=Salinarimonas chemoclinalis TaxID=3241599 RepID=UPI003557F70E
MASEPDFELGLSAHARERLEQRGLTIADLRWVLRTGFVTAPWRPGRLPGTFRYAVDGASPNTGSRKLRLVVVPDEEQCRIFVVTAMWLDAG